jgi:hypothetical protein
MIKNCLPDHLDHMLEAGTAGVRIYADGLLIQGRVDIFSKNQAINNNICYASSLIARVEELKL